ncbi:GerAB/ArcD/ProY family transporter [Cohnella nanjingensis]|uniref:GerAB/ArcD/ProY family transporter n=1 Tax=Cohnella nanjingensis TaxID=1387779 RepID=A0A7X0VDR8_9BACL|nr:GerAB/ArcD/ProY family transporter [Cohnella nanjingensis]MBB6669518.1 GerAB/ArcD/ProY family transporter [Cohnella nanjingensis]
MNKRMVLALFIQLHLAAILSLYATKILESTNSGHWEAILIACLLEVLLAWLYLSGLSAFPGKHIGEIIREAAGAWAARAILLPFVAYIFFYLVLQNRYQIVKINIVVLPSTPLWAVLLLNMVLPFYAACKGIHAIARMGLALFITFMPFVLFSLFISYQNFEWRNIFPIWQPKLTFVAEQPFYTSLFAFSGFLFLGMLSLNKPVKLRKLGPSMLLVAAFGFASVYVPLLIFGQETAIRFQYPVTMASDTIDLEWVVFDWLPTFSVVSSSALGMIESSVLLWMAMTLVRKLYLPLPDKWLAAILSIAMYICSMQIHNVQTLNRFFSMNAALCLYSMIILPLTLGLSGWRKRRTTS